MKDLKQKAVKGFFWSGVEKIGKQVIQFVLGIMIARVLTPADYGIMGLLGIFMAISGLILDSGIGSALIQKKDRTDTDFSTAFILNVFTGLVLYLILFLIAPLIADFFKIPILKSVTRVYAITLIINSFFIIQKARLSISFSFKEQAIISIIALTAGGLLGIFLAKKNYGVWALVFYSIAESLVSFLLYTFVAKWQIKLSFSKKSLKNLFSFGMNILGANFLTTLYNNLYALVIGKKMDAFNVGIYNRGKNFAEIPSTITSQILMRVTFPIFSELQDDDENFKNAFFKILYTEIYILTPVLAGMIILATPIIMFLLGKKWEECISITQILCMGSLWIPLIDTNINALYAKGKSKSILIFNTIQKPISVLLLFLSIPFGLKWMCICNALTSFVSFVSVAIMVQRQLHFSFLTQIKHISITVIEAFVMVFFIFISIKFMNSNILKLCLGFIIGVSVYIIEGFITKNEIFYSLMQIVKSKIAK
ncbi:lipopolysaccharide biosynthesis protein [Treponema pectinovorum]|uniref:lipopolysaccharide biosynthesis protein n=1 Tax=Treponema pectinovorum TaxID=164 RepID=UPI0011C77C56|nr:lipopolysaccharide biosynthesis protein [Treponema pectinovorum]